MASRKPKRSTPPPVAVVNALRTGQPVDRDLLMDWYTNRAPDWIRQKGISADLAVFLWQAPNPNRWDHVEMFVRRTD